VSSSHSSKSGVATSEHEIIASQSCGSSSPETKSHLDVGLAERCRVYYVGEGGGFPQVRAVVSLMSLRSPVACPSTKGAPTLY
jgi:hypothetical protein